MKTKTNAWSLWALMVLVASLLIVGVVKAATGQLTEVQITINSGTINIYSTGAFNFGQYTVSASQQTVTGWFTNYFSVEDMKGLNSGYYTTVQMSGNLRTSLGATIASTGISMSVTTTGTVLIAGFANPRVVVADSMIAYQTLDSARTLIKRDAAANTWVLGHYGTLPLMQVLIPGFATVGTYTGVLVYTLYEN